MDIKRLQFQVQSDSQAYFPNVDDQDTVSYFVYVALCLAGEAGEVGNKVKKLHRGSVTYAVLKKQMEDELPDVLIYLCMVANAFGINLEEAYDRKRAFNNARYLGGISD